MKRLTIISLLFAFVFSSVIAQNNDLADKLTVSNNSLNLNKQDIGLSDEAVGYLTDPEGKMIALDCIDPKTAKKKRPKHVLKVFNLADNKLMWSKDYIPENTYYKFLKQGIMEINDRNIILLNKMIGTEIWKENIQYIGLIGDTLIANKYYKIGAYNINNSNNLWSCSMNTNYGVTYSQPIYNNWIFLVSDNLYRINLSTGYMLKLKSKTGVEYSDGTGHFMFFAFGLIGYLTYNAATQYIHRNNNTGTYTNDGQLFMMPSKKFSGMHSNVVSKDGLNYYADYNSFKCFDDNLNLIYSTKINNKKINTLKYFIKESKSELIVKNDTAYVVNLGYGIHPKKGKKFYDFPHISSFNIKDGKALDNQRIAYDSVTIVSTNVNDTCINMLLYNRQESYRIADRYITYTNNDTSKVGHFISYLDDQICYVKNDDNSFSAIKHTEKYTPVLTTRGYVVDISERIPKVLAQKANTYFQIAQLNDMYFYQGGKDYNELWCFNSGQATLVAEDVKKVWQKNDKLEILTTAGKARIISIGK